MVKFAFNNAKNINISYTFFKLNGSSYLCSFYKKNVKLQSKSKAANKLLIKLKELTAVWEKSSSIVISFTNAILISI